MAKKLIFTILGFLFLIACRNDFQDETLLTQKNFDSKKSTFNSLILLPYHIDWNSETPGYSEHLKAEIKSYPISIDIQQNPNNEVSYQLIVAGDEKPKFYLLKISPNQNSINQKASLLNQDKFTGQLKLFDTNNNLIVDKKFRNGIESNDNNKTVSQRLEAVQDCVTETTYHYTDWYKKMSDGRLVYSHTTLDDVTYETECYIVPGGESSTSTTFTNDTKYREIVNKPFDDTMVDDPCENAKAGVLKANIAMSDSRLKTTFIEKMVNVAKTTKGAETSITIGKNEAGQLHIGDEVTKTGASGTMVDPPQGYKAFMDGHNHEFGHPPSPGDVWTMMERVANSEYFETRYVFTNDGNETIYALTVNYRQQALDFLVKYPKDKYLEKGSDGNYTGSLKEGTDIYYSYKESYDYYYNNISPGDFHARAAAQSYFLSKFNSGISISKKTKYDNALKTINSSSDDKGNYTTSQCN